MVLGFCFLFFFVSSYSPFKMSSLLSLATHTFNVPFSFIFKSMVMFGAFIFVFLSYNDSLVPFLISTQAISSQSVLVNTFCSIHFL